MFFGAINGLLAGLLELMTEAGGALEAMGNGITVWLPDILY